MSIADLVAGGGTVEIPAGTYDESLINTVPSGTRLVGHGQVWIRPSAGTGEMCFLVNQNQTDIEFDGINFDASQTIGGAIKVEAWSGGAPHNIRIKNAEIIGSPTSTIAVLFVGIEANSPGGNQLINCKVHGGGIYDRDHGVYVQSGDNLIDGCEFWDLCGGGVQFYNGYGHPRTGNVVKNTIIRDLRPGIQGDGGQPGRHCGIYAYSQNNLSIQGCTITNIPNNGGGTTGIEISSDNVLVDGCQIHGVQGMAVAGVSGSGNIVRNSDLTGNEGTISGTVTDEGGSAPGPIDPPPVEPARGMPSPDGTTIAPATEITDNHSNLWTMHGQAVMLNGTDSGGAGTQLLFCGGEMYTLGTDGQWWKFQYESGWVAHGPDPRGGGELEEGYEQEGEAGSKPPLG